MPAVRYSSVTFATLEQAEQFVRMLLRGHQGDPLLVLTTDARGRIVVSGTWEDPLGAVAAVIKDNRVLWTRNPALSLTVDNGAVTFTMDGEMMWQVRMHLGAVTLEGLFFTDQGMVAVTPWGFVGWTAEDAGRVVDDVTAPDALRPATLPRPVH